MNIWHDMNPEFVKKDSFQVVIEITKGSKLKYELDKASGLLRLDRILYTSTHYPANYGFIPLTYADDDDPLDVLVICAEQIMPMTIVDCYPIGVIKMIDGGRVDEKVIAIAKSDPYYNEYKSIYDLPAHVFDEMKHFFSVYKQLEYKDTAVDKLFDHKEAERVVEACINNYKENKEMLMARYSKGSSNVY